MSARKSLYRKATLTEVAVLQLAIKKPKVKTPKPPPKGAKRKMKR